MARGDITVFDESKEAIAQGVHNIGTDTYKMALVTNATVPLPGTTSPALGDFTEVVGTGYTAGGFTMTMSVSEAAGTVTVATTNTVVLSQDPAGPSNIFYGLVYNDTDAAKPALCFIEITSDGVTGLDTVSRNLTINSGTLFTVS